MLDGILGKLWELGMNVRGSAAPEHADTEFDALDFDLIVFGSGAIGPLTVRLRQEFAQRNPAVRFLDSFAPLGVRQIIAAATKSRYLLEDFTVLPTETGVRISGTVAEPSTVTVTVYRLADGGFDVEELGRASVGAGPYEHPVAAEALVGGHVLVAAVGEDEFHVHRIPGQIAG